MQGVLTMRPPAKSKKEPVSPGHVRVLAGDKQVSEMLVFLMHRKLKTLLQGGTERGPAGGRTGNRMVKDENDSGQR